MSIAPPVGAMSGHLSRLLSGRPYVTLRNLGRTFAEALPKPLGVTPVTAAVMATVAANAACHHGTMRCHHPVSAAGSAFFSLTRPSS